MALPWKGNVRELDNVIEHTMILAEGERITMKDLPPAVIAGSDGQPAFTFNLRDGQRQFEKRHILGALEQANHDKREAPRLLEISLSSLLPQDRRVGDRLQAFLSRIILLIKNRPARFSLPWEWIAIFAAVFVASLLRHDHIGGFR
jgi:DNA-binding NtrC family response regulator